MSIKQMTNMSYLFMAFAIIMAMVSIVMFMTFDILHCCRMLNIKRFINVKKRSIPQGVMSAGKYHEKKQAAMNKNDDMAQTTEKLEDHKIERTVLLPTKDLEIVQDISEYYTHYM